MSLTAGEYYWIDVFVVNWSGGGHYTLSVETPEPSDGAKWANSMKQIQEIKITPTKTNQKWSFKMFNSDQEFKFKLKYTNPANRKVELDEETGGKTW